MKASVKAILISALIFPGLGHWALRPRRGGRGLLFLLPAAAGVLYLLNTTLQLLNQLLAEVDNGTLALDPVAMVQRVHDAGIDNPATNLASLVLIVCWIGSVVDVIWLSRRTPE